MVKHHRQQPVGYKTKYGVEVGFQLLLEETIEGELNFSRKSSLRPNICLEGRDSNVDFYLLNWITESWMIEVLPY